MSNPRTQGARTLWSKGASADPRMMAYTIGSDRTTDSRLIEWDIVGSLGHIEGLRASSLLAQGEYTRLRKGLQGALTAARGGELTIGAEHEDVHSAVEDWLTQRLGSTGERLHTGRSRNDQVAVDLRLYLKDTILLLHTRALELCLTLLDFARRHHRVLWPGYTHQRRAMPSSVGLWAGGLAEGVLTSAEAVHGVWPRVDRRPLGSAAGYGLPLAVDREVAMRALGFAELDHVVTSVQLGRGKLEAAVLAWCVDLAHDLSRAATDVITLSSDELGFLVLPSELATGSSIMPHKRNPDLFELTRGRAAAVEGDLCTVLAVKGKLGGGYHRDFQLLKEPLFRGLDRSEEMLSMLTHALPRLGVDRARAAAALQGDLLATDEVMRRVEAGVPFRRAYREVAAELSAGASFPPSPTADLVRRRSGSGNLGNLGLEGLRRRVRAARGWNRGERGRFERALKRLVGSES